MTVVAMSSSLSAFVLVATMRIISVSAAATCFVIFGAQSCEYFGTELTMTYPIALRVSDAPDGTSTFTANVMLRGGTEDGTFIPMSHATDGTDETIDVRHVFDPYDSVNYMGYTVTFDADLGCRASFYEKYFSITVGGGRCVIDNTVDISEIPDGTFVDDINNAIATTSVPTTDGAAVEDSNPPTMGSTPSPITPIVTTPPPSYMSPTIKPSTSPIVVIIPLIPPTTLPTTSLSSTPPNPVVTIQPSGESTSIVSSPAPSYGASPSTFTYTAPSCIMQLRTAEYMDRYAQDVWTSVTSKTIRNQVAYQVGVPQPDLITVAITITKQEKLSESGRRMRRILKHQQQQQRRRRNLQSTTTTPSTSSLTISFSTVITFPSTTTRRREEDWSVIELVGGGFTSIKEQKYYISQLVSADEVGDFDNVNSMELIVDGKTVTDDEENDDEENNAESTFIFTIPMIAGAAAGGVGVLFCLSAVFFVLCRSKRRREKGTTNNNDHVKRKKTFMTTTTNGADNGGTTTENPTTFDDNNTLNPQSYFGTINPTDDGDDVSTLGDPYVGELISPAAMDATTVASGGLMSLQEKLFVYGVSGLSSRVGSTGVESRMGDTMLTGSNKTMMFGDDATLEAMYQTTTPTTTTEQTPAVLDFITIVAPSGVLGVVLNNTGVEFPIVFAVKDSSPLYGRVEVGDMLVSVDEVHCKGMSSHTVSSFLSSRSHNPGRKLTLARASVDTRSTA